MYEGGSTTIVNNYYNNDDNDTTNVYQVGEQGANPLTNLLRERERVPSLLFCFITEGIVLACAPWNVQSPSPVCMPHFLLLAGLHVLQDDGDNGDYGGDDYGGGGDFDGGGDW